MFTHLQASSRPTGFHPGDLVRADFARADFARGVNLGSGVAVPSDTLNLKIAHWRHTRRLPDRPPKGGARNRVLMAAPQARLMLRRLWRRLRQRLRLELAIALGRQSLAARRGKFGLRRLEIGDERRFGMKGATVAAPMKRPSITSLSQWTLQTTRLSPKARPRARIASL